MKRLLKLFPLLALAALPAAAQTQSPVRIRCGGPSYTDSKGQVWQADQYFNGGTASSLAATIAGTPDPSLYQDYRYDSQSLIYTVPLQNGTYHVNLYFAETYAPLQKVGGRVFNVKMQGNPVFSNVDVFSEAGANAALIKGSDVTVSGGKFRLEFDNVVQYSKINAIEILPGTSGPLMTLNFQYPDGSPVNGTLNYNITSSLLSMQGGQLLSNGQATCALFANPSALGISVQFQAQLSLVDSKGNTLWQMTLGLNPAQVNLGDVQSSSLNVIVQKM